MLAKIHSFGINGLTTFPVTIEVDVSNGLPSTTIVGLPDNAIKESRERVRAALRNSGYDYPLKRITINLSPADIKKEGPCYDLPIALGILIASGQALKVNQDRLAFAGELSLDGKLKCIRGALAMSLASVQQNFAGLIISMGNRDEALLCEDAQVYAFNTLKEAIAFITSEPGIYKADTRDTNLPEQPGTYEDFSDVKGQYFAKRGLEIAAAGGHNALMIGPPGSGKSMLAKRFCGILPNLTKDEMLEVTLIRSVSHPPSERTGLISARPFRSPHHTTSGVALVGGGSNPRPGEVTMSHRGVLFLDELPEFGRSALEALRQPIEDKCVNISRANRSVRFPANFQLIAAMNPTRSGNFQDMDDRYFSRISGPLMDRIDLHIEVHNLPASELLSRGSGEPTSAIKNRVLKAREVQHKRFDSKHITNAGMNRRDIKQYCPLKEKSRNLLTQAIDELKLSARGYDKIIKLSRTIADLEGSEDIDTGHIAEAIQFRTLDRMAAART